MDRHHPGGRCRDDVVVEPVGAEVASANMVALMPAGSSHEGEEISQQERIGGRVMAGR